MIELPNAAALLDRYDAFLIDQFGTLHDGITLYPGALAGLLALRAAGKQVALLSNSGRRAAPNVARLTRMGIPPDAYGAFITSAEAAAALLARGEIAAARGARACFALERYGDGSLLPSLGLEVASAERADLLLISGSEADSRPMAYYTGILAPLAQRGVPGICISPDRIMLTPAGHVFGAGQIAEAYEAMGGHVTWIGKPYPAIFHAALTALGNPDPARVAVIGDSVEHDIAGAHTAGCAGWLLRDGIIAGWDNAAIAEECARVGATPAGMLTALG